MASEAAYRCRKCESIYHVRCMGTADGTAQRTVKYKTECYLCCMASSLATDSTTSARLSGNSDQSNGGDGSRDIIEDVMVVCAPDPS